LGGISNIIVSFYLAVLITTVSYILTAVAFVFIEESILPLLPERIIHPEKFGIERRERFNFEYGEFFFPEDKTEMDFFSLEDTVETLKKRREIISVWYCDIGEKVIKINLN
jgi:hypothetical protein